MFKLEQKISEFDDVDKALDKVKDNKTTVKFERDGKKRSQLN
ncbi:hypothetical protein ACVQ9Z_13460 [Staphylococcus aureus]